MKNKKVKIIPIAFLCMLLATTISCTTGVLPSADQNNSEAPSNLQESQSNSSIPHYFLAIHNEPFHDTLMQQEKLESSYELLGQMIEQASKYHIKLTLMFTAQWAEFIASDPEKMAELASWQQNGHEIAAHHHSIYHGGWDGYTNYTEEIAINERLLHAKIPEEYLGTLTDYMNILKKINPDIHSGCVNDETDKHALPDEIIYDTCSGFANSSSPGNSLSDTDPQKGVNEFISVGSYKGIERKGLTHFQMTTLERQTAAQEVFNSMSSGVYGSVNHSSQREAQAFLAWLEFLHQKDPQGAYSRTVSEVIEQGLLTEMNLSMEFTSKYPCGDRICDHLEKENPDLCPQDCLID